jgi:hypothetical protein
MFVPGLPRSWWAYRDRVTALVAAKSRVVLLFRAPFCMKLVQRIKHLHQATDRQTETRLPHDFFYSVKNTAPAFTFRLTV